MDVNDLLTSLAVPDLQDRLGLVERRILETLEHDGARLGPPSIRVAGSGGKRLRPVFTIACAQLGGVFDERVVAGAAAVELVQVGSLVHDDIFEDAPTRRGTPTINAVEGNDIALLAGDFILARAGTEAATVNAEAAGLLARTIVALCEGQMLEMCDQSDVDRPIDRCLRSVAGKTAALFAASCEMGVLCTDLGPATQEAVRRFGHEFGMAFQVLDDVLDVIADPDRLGKPVGIDIATGVYTVPVLYALEGPRGDELRSLLRRNEPNDLVAALQLVRSSEGIDRALGLAREHADRAATALDALPDAPVRGLYELPGRYLDWALGHFTGDHSRTGA